MRYHLSRYVKGRGFGTDINAVVRFSSVNTSEAVKGVVVMT